MSEAWKGDGKYPLKVKGMLFDRNGGEWVRTMLRRGPDGEAHWMRVHYVPAKTVTVCFRCLSHRVMHERIKDPNPPRRWHRCLGCGFDFLIDYTRNT